MRWGGAMFHRKDELSKPLLLHPRGQHQADAKLDIRQQKTSEKLIN